MDNNFADETSRLSYAMGMNMAEYIMNNPVATNHAAALDGIRDRLANTAKLDNEQYVDAMRKLQALMEQAGREQFRKVAETHAAAEKEFMAANAKKSGVVVTPSGLQYEVISNGSGKKPAADSKVKVHYVGTLLNGNEFDSSVRRGQPAEFGVNQVIAGWTEALQLMPVGSKYKLYIPAKLAYGERGAGQAIPPNAALIFEVELLDIVG